MVKEDKKRENQMSVLIACEESQIVTKEMRLIGVEAYSCDVLPCSGGHPEWHLQQDVKKLLKQKWDMIIAFPPCTYLTVTGNRWFNVKQYGAKAVQRYKDQEEAVRFFMLFANANCQRIAIENPVGVMSSKWRKPDCIIQPYQFGDPFEKRTCLWIKGLPPLLPTNKINPPTRIMMKSGKTVSKWHMETWYLPRKERTKVRSRTFPGIAKAMASQWGTLIIKKGGTYAW